MLESVVIPVFILLAGLFSAVCAVMDYNWFMEHRKAQFFVRIMGRTATRVFYFTIGAALFVMGIVFLYTGGVAQQ